MTIFNDASVSVATRQARHQRLLDSLGPLAGPVITIDPKYFVDKDLSDPDNDRTLLRPEWRDGLDITGTWAVSGGLLPPKFKLEAASGSPDGTYILLHEATLARGDKSHTYTIPPAALPWEGDVYLRVLISINNGADEPSEPFLVRLDKVAPYEGSGIEHPPAPVPASKIVTDADLAAGFSLQIPGYPDHQPGDMVYVWLEKELPGGNPPQLLVSPQATQAGGTTVQVPEANMVAKGDGRFFLGYVLADKAGNISAVSEGAAVTLVLGTLPSTLGAPTVPAADPVIDRADAKDGVYVDVPEMQGWKAGDQVTVTFGGQTLPPYTLNPGAYQALVDVPQQVLLSVFGTSATEVEVDVTYTVSRLDWSSAASPVEKVLLDLSKAGPENPGWPDPVNDQLLPVAVTSSSGQEDEIPEADLGKAATLTFTVYPDAKAGETVEFFWGAAPFEQYTLTDDDIAANEVEVTIPWAAIETTLAQVAVEVFYRIRLANAPEENYQQSPSTTVDVSALPLVATPVSFAQGDDASIPGYLIIGCSHLTVVDGIKYIEVLIPDLSQAPHNQVEGDVVTLNWKGFSGTTLDGDQITAIDKDDGGEFSENHTLAADELTGFSWLVPYDPYGAVTFRYNGSSSDEGMIQVSYSIQAGDKQAVATAPDNVIAAFYLPSGPCGTSIDAACTSCRLG
ncbi:hypothetical protein [Pseudomonas sp. RIT-PI-S]|uniref:hypothetical protein n=1 Tax=Pseudomonas sp. RIT-PI-S TaxID=3035295 RepID=UPI0021D903E2|nr:hypothetical protein [Pseudomonas sp. RIT-PI-S]